MKLRLESALAQAHATLLGLRSGEGIWEGKLSASALATATAVVALALAKREQPATADQLDALIHRGLGWLAAHANPDGGWGDTVLSRSNLSTTTLAWAAFGMSADAERRHGQSIAAAEKWLSQCIGT